ncbi:MAG: glycoside hydrolase family 2 protein [Anaerolineae bacterium]|nr:glycoside hydrolase family 2 protein [Anaerolineae bacterium]
MFDLWKLHDFDPGVGLAAGVHRIDFDETGWVDVPVPGDVHRALLAAGWIQDPFYDRNEDSVRWMEEKEWWYRLRFNGPEAPPAPGERDRLIFHGMDTFATVYLNGEPLGSHRNMFRPAAFDVSGVLRYGAPNTLAVRFDPPLACVPDVSSVEPWGPNQERIFMRKAQFGFGWDWGPRLPTIGLWRPVELRRERAATLRGVHFHTLHLTPARDKAIVAVRVEVDRFAAEGSLGAAIRLTTPDGGATARYPLNIAADEATAHLTIKAPTLWWTHDLGDPALYTLEVDLLAGDAVVDTWRGRVGVRTVALDQSVDTAEPGTRFFRFVLNGVPIFAKGANWIPADSFVGAIPAERYEMLLTAAREAHMNMLRVWGGGIYEHDVFYDLCDALGILIWQDFMFSCAPYPEDLPDFTAEVEAEAEYQVRRLRSHPCLALWCGNNENQWLHDMRNFATPGVPVPGALFYHDLLPRIVAALDGVTPYWPGSPYGGNDFNSQEDGDRHNWNAWHGNYDRRFGELPRQDTSPESVSYRRYAEDRGRFISEFGLHAAPVLETLRRVIPEDQLYHHSPSMDHHNKDNPKNKGDNLMVSVTSLPATLEEYIDFSMIAQAEGLKFAIEHFRRRKPHCAGTLVWQLNDCWPVLSWSVLDYYGFGKAGYYAVRRAYAPVLASFRESADGLELWITNDTLADVQETAIVRLATFSGETLYEETVGFSVAANSSACVACWRTEQLPGGPDRYVSVRKDVLFPPNRHFFTPVKDLQRATAELMVEFDPVSDHELVVSVSASTYASFVHLTVPHEATRYSDNYFDLFPGETRAVTIRNDAVVLTPEMVTVRGR